MKQETFWIAAIVVMLMILAIYIPTFYTGVFHSLVSLF